MRRWYPLLLSAVLLFGLQMARASSPSPGETFLENFLAHAKSLQADFEQTLRAKDGEVLQQSRGRFYLQRPGRFRWDYQSPYQQQIVGDGERVWIYDVDLEQVTVQKAGQLIGATPMALLQDSASLHRQFRIEPLDARDGIYRLRLISRKADNDFGEVVVGIDKQGLRFLQLHDQFEQVTDIVFSDIKTNPPLAASLFHFEPPEGVDVFGGG